MLRKAMILLALAGLCLPAQAQDRRQDDKNLMRILGTGLGAAALDAAQKGNSGAALLWGAGAAYAGKKYEDARKAQQRDAYCDNDDRGRRDDRNDRWDDRDDRWRREKDRRWEQEVRERERRARERMERERRERWERERRERERWEREHHDRWNDRRDRDDCDRHR